MYEHGHGKREMDGGGEMGGGWGDGTMGGRGGDHWLQTLN